jgi:hypothetical protein
MAGEGATEAGVFGRHRGRREQRNHERLEKIRAKSGNRYRIHYDIDGPRVRLGMLWFAGAVAATIMGIGALGLYYGLAAAAAAAHTARTWRARGASADSAVAFAGAALITAGAIVGPQIMGLAILVSVGGFVAVSIADRRGDFLAAMGEAGLLVQVAIPPAVAVGCLVLLADLELWAAISLIAIVSAYETGDYLIGSGAPNVLEGPIAGFASAMVITLVVSALGVPPFSIGEAMAYGAAASILCLGGQFLASVLLPHSRAYAPALRRIDSLLLSAPLWYAGVDLFVL